MDGMTNRIASVVLTCEWCGSGFHPINGRAKIMRFCSKTCRDNGVRKPIREMSPEETAWLAGLFDGEGCISIRAQLNQTGARGVRIQVTNTNRELLEEVKRVTGIGFISMRYRNDPRHKPTFDWQTAGGNAKGVLQLISHRLIAKKARALEAINS